MESSAGVTVDLEPPQHPWTVLGTAEPSRAGSSDRGREPPVIKQTERQTFQDKADQTPVHRAAV